MSLNPRNCGNCRGFYLPIQNYCIKLKSNPPDGKETIACAFHSDGDKK